MIKGKWILGSEDITDAIAVRNAVFNEELQLSADFSAQDALSMHAVIYDDDTPAASARLLFHGDELVIDALCVKKEHRGRLIGDLLIRLTILKALDFTDTVYAHTLAEAQPFFEKYGFAEAGEAAVISGVNAPLMRATQQQITAACVFESCKGCSGCKGGNA